MIMAAVQKQFTGICWVDRKNRQHGMTELDNFHNKILRKEVIFYVKLREKWLLFVYNTNLCILAAFDGTF